MNVLIDARKLGDGGIGTYLKNLVTGLLESALCKVHLIVSSNENASLILFGKENQNGLPSNVQYIEDTSSKYSFDEYFRLVKRFDWSRYDIFHAPHYTLPFGIPIPCITTIHDIIHIRKPEKVYYPFVAYPLLRHAVQRSDEIIAVSHAAKKDITSLFLTEGKRLEISEKITVIPNSVSKEFLCNYSISFECPELFSGSIAEVFKTKKILFSLYSNDKPHKGRRDAVEAFMMLQEQYPELMNDFVLVLAGRGLVDVKNDYLDKRIIVLGELTAEQLQRLYRISYSYLMSSTIEGFCLPVLESKFFGTRVVSRPVDAVLEILDSEDIVAKDFSIVSLAQALYKAILKEGHRAKMADEFREKYCYTRNALRTLEIYKKAVSGKR